MELQEQRRLQEAITKDDEAIHLNPQDAENYCNRGLSYFYRGEYDLTVADYSKAIELKPDYVEAHGNRAQVYLNKGEYDLAIADCNKAVVNQRNGTLFKSNTLA